MLPHLQMPSGSARGHYNVVVGWMPSIDQRWGRGSRRRSADWDTTWVPSGLCDPPGVVGLALELEAYVGHTLPAMLGHQLQVWVLLLHKRATVLTSY